MKSAPSLDARRRACAARSAIAAMRSVSLTRQLAMLRQPRRAVGVQRHHGQRHRGVGDVRCSRASIGASGQRPRRTSSQPGPRVDVRAHRPRRVDEARCRPGSNRCRRLRCAAARRCAAIAPAATKYDADDASPSTTKRARRAQRGRRAMVKRCQPSRSTVDAEARQQVQRDLDVGLGDQLALDLDRRRRPRRRRQRQRQQQRGQELARDVAARRGSARPRARAAPAPAVDAQRRIAGLPR